jgi:hypothetical protein
MNLVKKARVKTRSAGLFSKSVRAVSGVGGTYYRGWWNALAGKKTRVKRK